MAKFIQLREDIEDATCRVFVKNPGPTIVFVLVSMFVMFIIMSSLMSLLTKSDLFKGDQGGNFFIMCFFGILILFMLVMMIGLKKYHKKESVVFKENGIQTELFGLIEYSNIESLKNKVIKGNEIMEFKMKNSGKIIFGPTNSFIKDARNEFEKFKNNLNQVHY